MKYSQLISFSPIEDVIQLAMSKDRSKAIDFVKTYVMSDSMAEAMQAPVIDQLQLDEAIDNKGVLIVGNYGTGKSHIMSVISAIASDENYVKYLQNESFKHNVMPIAGKFEVLRIEIGGVTMPLYDVIMGDIHDDFIQRGINFDFPSYNSVRNIKSVIQNMMIAFSEKYQDKGYLLVVDEFLSYLSSRDERQIVLDLEFFRALGEMCSRSKLRVVFGMQEKIFDNPRFSFVADTLKHVSDRFTQLIITKEATSYVVSERVLKKNKEQKALIRKHLEKFCHLYTGMSSRLEEFVELFPIHPSYIDVFNKIYLIENRHILKNISLTIKNIFNCEVPELSPGIISFDNYWPAIKSNGLLRSDVTINRVVNASQQLEDIINRAFTKAVYKPLAQKIIYALSVHRLTTNGLDVQFGLTAEKLKDDLCLYLSMPEESSDFLLSVINTTLKEIMTTVSGQFIVFNEINNQYYIDVDKVVDYDERIKQKASIMAEGELNRYFYDVVYRCLEWDAKQYVTNFNIYEYELNWDSHNVFRKGYLFMGLPGERSTAQPERDFYIHIMPPFDIDESSVQNLPDEVYLYFKNTDSFRENVGMYAASCSLADISDGKDKASYQNKADMLRRKLTKYLSENKNTCFDVLYKKRKRQMIEVLKERYKPDLTFKDTIDLASSLIFDEHFSSIYPDFPSMLTKLTSRNMNDCVRAAFDHFAGRKTQLSKAMLGSFGVLDGEKICPNNSKFASHYIELLKNMAPKSSLNFSDIFEPRSMEYIEKKFKIEYIFMPIIFLSLVYSGDAVITLKDGKIITASNLDLIPKINVMDLCEFKYLSKPAQVSITELKHLFEVIELNPALIDNPNDREIGVEYLLIKAQEMSKKAAMLANKLTNGFELWGEKLVCSSDSKRLLDACNAVNNEFSNYSSKFNTPAKLSNFSLSIEQIDKLSDQIRLTNLIPQFLDFKSECGDIVGYIQKIEVSDASGIFKNDIAKAKSEYRSQLDCIMSGEKGNIAGKNVVFSLEKIKSKYIDFYFDVHKKNRLDITNARHKCGIQDGKPLAILRKLRAIDILSDVKLRGIERELERLVVCYELTPEELKNSPVCPHCQFHMYDEDINASEKIEQIECNVNDLLIEWTNTLKKTISDPILSSLKSYLPDDQLNVINSFLETGSLYRCDCSLFVKAINSLLKGFDPVVIYSDELVSKLEQLPPLDENSLKNKISEILSSYTKGKDSSKLRIVFKRKWSGM